MTSKEYYKTYQADECFSELSEKVCTLINQEEAVHAFEFGSGSGKHLARLRAKGISPFGLDISILNCIKAIMHMDGIACGDEGYLRHLVNFDCVFTVSVLDHIENVTPIINEFKRICNKSIFLCEAQHHEPENFYWNHDYEGQNFKDLGYEFVSNGADGDGHAYRIWKWSKGSDIKEFVAHDDLG